MTEDQGEIRRVIDEHLTRGKVLHLATVANGVPWLCHVWYAVGTDRDSLVFTSNQNRRHSSDIRANPLVSGGVVPIVLDGLGQKVQGISFEGQAHEATGELIISAYEAYASKWPNVRSMFSARDVALGATNMRMFVVKMIRVVLFDEINFKDSPRQEIQLT